jgi:hypothetical protein
VRGFGHQFSFVSSEFLVKMEKVTAEIDFIKLALGSFRIFRDDKERTAFLDSELLKNNDPVLRIQLSAYIEMTKAELKAAKDKLDELEVIRNELEVELQREKNLLQEKELKQLASSAGNCCFVVLIDSLIGSIIWFCFLIFISI